MSGLAFLQRRTRSETEEVSGPRRRAFAGASADPFELSGMWPDTKMRYIRHHDQVYLLNGRNRMRAFTGTGFRLAGISKPASTGFAAADAAVAGDLDGEYHYKITAANTKIKTADERVVESLPIELTPITVQASQVTISLPVLHGDTQVTHWIIYRNKAGYLDASQEDDVQDFFKVAEVAIGTTSYTDNTPDDSLEPRPTCSFKAEIMPASKYACIYANTLFGCGFDTFETGTATLVGTQEVEIAGLTGLGLPDGLRGCYFQKKGDDRRYLILGLQSNTRLRLDAAFQGTLSAAEYRIFQDGSALFYSQLDDVEKAGYELDWNTEFIGGRGSKLKLTGVFPAHGVCYVFTLDQVYRLWQVTGEGEDLAFNISQQPIIDGIGCVSSWTCVLVQGTLYWLSAKGPVAFNPDATGQEGFARIGEPLGEGWANDLNISQLGLSEGAYDPIFHRVKWAVPLADEYVNGKVIVYDIRTGTWWIEEDWGPNYYWSDFDSNGKQRLLSAVGRHMFFEDEDHNDGVPGGTKEATVTSYAAGVVTCSAASFWTTGYGLEDRWAHVYRLTAGTYVRLGKSKIASNTGQALTLRDVSDFTSAPASGDIVYVGPITFRWRTKTFAYPEVNQKALDFIARFALQGETSGSESYLWYRTVENQNNQTGMPRVQVDQNHFELPSNTGGPEVALDIEIREPDAEIALRSLTLETNPTQGQE